MAVVPVIVRGDVSSLRQAVESSVAVCEHAVEIMKKNVVEIEKMKRNVKKQGKDEVLQVDGGADLVENKSGGMSYMVYVVVLGTGIGLAYILSSTVSAPHTVTLHR